MSSTGRPRRKKPNPDQNQQSDQQQSPALPTPSTITNDWINHARRKQLEDMLAENKKATRESMKKLDVGTLRSIAQTSFKPWNNRPAGPSLLDYEPEGDSLPPQNVPLDAHLSPTGHANPQHDTNSKQAGSGSKGSKRSRDAPQSQGTVPQSQGGPPAAKKSKKNQDAVQTVSFFSFPFTRESCV